MLNWLLLAWWQVGPVNHREMWEVGTQAWCHGFSWNIEITPTVNAVAWAGFDHLHKRIPP
jgi:hypothetical protein